MKYLLSQEEIDVNKLTLKGTALHMACNLNKPSYVSMLLGKNADPSIMNNEGYIPADLCTSEEIIKIINKDTKTKEKATICINQNEVFIIFFYYLNFGNFWEFLGVFGKFLEIFGNFWKFLEILEIFGNFWKFLKLYKKILN